MLWTWSKNNIQPSIRWGPNLQNGRENREKDRLDKKQSWWQARQHWFYLDQYQKPSSIDQQDRCLGEVDSQKYCSSLDKPIGK